MDDEKGLPKTSVSSLMKEVLGPHVKYSNTLVQYVHEIANEFVSKVGDDANKKCIEKGKMKISIDDVKQTLKEVGLEDYMSQLDLDHDDYLKDNQEKNKFKAKHMTEEERNQKVLEQNQMFQKMNLEKGSSMNIEEAHVTAEQKKEKEILQNLKKDDEEDFDEF